MYLIFVLKNGINTFFRGNVTITDLAEFLPLMNLNIEANREKLSGEMCARELKWGEEYTGFNPPVDFLLLADCIYYEEVMFSLPFYLFCGK